MKNSIASTFGAAVIALMPLTAYTQNAPASKQAEPEAKVLPAPGATAENAYVVSESGDEGNELSPRQQAKAFSRDNIGGVGVFIRIGQDNNGATEQQIVEGYSAYFAQLGLEDFEIFPVRGNLDATSSSFFVLDQPVKSVVFNDQLPEVVPVVRTAQLKAKLQAAQEANKAYNNNN